MSTKTDSLIKVENLSIGFDADGGESLAVKGVSFEIGKGQVMGLVGESGSGKTVTSLSVMKLLPRKSAIIKSGRILFQPKGGKLVDLLKQPENFMHNIRGKHIAMIFQEPMTSLNPVVKCGKQVAEVLLWHKMATKNNVKLKVLSLFEEVRLPDPQRAFSSYPHQLSGGQRQRVMIAMAIACKPSLLIADEPTTALDVTVQKNILELIKDLQNKYQMSILFITHDLGVVYNIADKIAVLYKGEIVESGSVKEVFHNPAHPYTKGLINCRPPLDERPGKLPVVADFLNTDLQADADRADSNNNDSSELKRKSRHKRIYSEKPALVVENLKTTFVSSRNFWGKAKFSYNAVDDVSFSVYEGETLGMVGESGCGKTTLGRTILQLLDPSEGKVIFKGVDLSSLKGKRLRQLRPKIQIVFQDPYSSLTPGIQVGKAILEPMKLHKILDTESQRRARIIELLEKVGLEEKHFYRYPHEFSGGQRQRICIARALALDPDFIICDESVSSLDVSVQAQVLNLLNKLKDELGLTYIFISHDLSVVKYMSDRIMVMHNGKIVELEEADALYKNPGSHYTKTLINAIPEIK